MAKKRAKPGGLPDGTKLLLRNKRAGYDYEITETLEAGLVLVGSEVKSLREGNGSLNEGFVAIRGHEAFLVNALIKEYPWANQFNHEPTRERKLLLHDREITRLEVAVAQKGLSVVPMQAYLKQGRIKLQIGVGRGRKRFEKREASKEAQARRDIDRALQRERKP